MKEKQTGAPTPKRIEDITAVEVLDAAREEIAGIRREMYEIARRVARYDRMWESAFREEAENRLGLKGPGEMGAEVRYSALDRLNAKVSELKRR